jgi:DNA-binding beta-propeller fold protein YncE
VNGAVHNTYVTPDGKYVIAGSIAGKNITVIDAQTEQPVWVMDFDLGVRPIAFDTKPDGSTKNMYVQLSDLNGFAVVDFAARKELTRVKLPELPAGRKPFEGGGNASHGIAVTADGKTLVVCSRLNTAVYTYSLPDLNFMDRLTLGTRRIG